MEFSAVLPLVAICLLLVAQIGLLVAERLAAQHGAREGARVAALGGERAEVAAATLRASNIDAARAEVTVELTERAPGTLVSVRLTYRPTLMPLVGRFMPDTRLEASAAMRAERGAPP